MKEIAGSLEAKLDEQKLNEIGDIIAECGLGKPEDAE